MTKRLTEQWRDGTLPDGYYYIDYDTQKRIFEIEDGCATYEGLPAETYFLNDVCLIKVLALVPSYDEYKRLQERLEEAERFVKHDAYAEGLFGWAYTDRHGVVHENNLASKYCEKYGLAPEHYSMYELRKFKKIIYKEDVARKCEIYTHPSIQMESLGYKIKHEELKSLGKRWFFWVDDYIEPMPEYLEKSGV